MRQRRRLRPRINPADERLRAFERAIESGEIEPSPEVGYQLYTEHQRLGAVREDFDSPRYVTSTPHGRLEITVSDAENLFVQNESNVYPRDRPDWWQDPWVFNRIPILFSAWPEFVNGRWEAGLSSYLRRADARGSFSPSLSARRKLEAAVVEAVSAWTAANPQLMQAGVLRSVKEEIDRNAEKLQDLEAAADEVRARIGELYLREWSLRRRVGQNPPRRR